MCQRSSASGHTIFGEALIAAVGLLGFFLVAGSGRIQVLSDIWPYVGILVVIVLFYAALLLCRAVFHFMAGSDSFWWQKYEDQYIDHKKKEKQE
ncbi:MAG: hypothetical protein JWM56_48 [Candidatus Peribacteria bacterium]|nr:hypothetical protein [Candidatus Peribacteria bacterium]